MLLSIVTFGIYGIWLTYVIARDTNVACEGDGKHTRGVIALLFFSLITVGIYSIVWQISLLKRWANKAESRGEKPACTCIDWVIWCLLLSFTGIGVLVFQYKQIKGLNQVCSLYNNGATIQATVVAQ